MGWLLTINVGIIKTTKIYATCHNYLSVKFLTINCWSRHDDSLVKDTIIQVRKNLEVVVLNIWEILLQFS
jgi:hypothetical protein